MPRKKHRPATHPPPLKGFPRKAILELNLNREVGIWVTVTWGKGGISYPRGRWVEKRAQEQKEGRTSFKVTLLIPLGRLYEVGQRKTELGDRRPCLEAWNLSCGSGGLCWGFRVDRSYVLS